MPNYDKLIVAVSQLVKQHAGPDLLHAEFSIHYKSDGIFIDHRANTGPFNGTRGLCNATTKFYKGEGNGPEDT